PETAGANVPDRWRGWRLGRRPRFRCSGERKDVKVAPTVSALVGRSVLISLVPSVDEADVATVDGLESTIKSARDRKRWKFTLRSLAPSLSKLLLLLVAERTKGLIVGSNLGRKMDRLMMMMIWATLMALLMAAIISQTRKLRRSHKRARLPAGSPGWPLVGETFEFVSCAYSPRPESFMDKRRLLYGKVFRSHLFGCPTIVSTDAEVSRWVLQSDGRSFVPSYPKSLTELLGKSSILLINGNLQRRVHGLIGAFFKSSDLKAQITRDLQCYVQQSMNSWSNERLIHIQDEAKHVSPRSPLPSPILPLTNSTQKKLNQFDLPIRSSSKYW
ncbi:hypothetical protein BHE74_00043490, partial [Ensete ventricosum]